MKRNSFAIFIAFCLALSLMPATALAVEKSYYNGADTSWYDGHETDSTFALTDKADLPGAFPAGQQPRHLLCGQNREAEREH